MIMGFQTLGRRASCARLDYLQSKRKKRKAFNSIARRPNFRRRVVSTPAGRDPLLDRELLAFADECWKKKPIAWRIWNGRPGEIRGRLAIFRRLIRRGSGTAAARSYSALFSLARRPKLGWLDGGEGVKRW